MIKEGWYLINTDNWFTAPDGEMYTAVWGHCKVLTTKEAMEFNPVRSTNWFIKVGEGEGSILIAGCQVHYCVECKKRPVQLTHEYECSNTKRAMTSNRIYFVPTNTEN